ncbi:MAG: nitronate monooxygenase, partial [Gammaproteobacteria bacterium]
MRVLEQLRLPIVQGPMAGGACTSALIAGVAQGGGLGSMAGSLLSPEKIRAQAAEIRALTDRPFLINLFVQDTPQPSTEQVDAACAWLRPVLDRLGTDSLPMPAKWCEDFGAQLDALVEVRPAVASFTFDILKRAQVERLHAASIEV